MKKERIREQVSWKELVLYFLGGLLAVAGIVLVSFGLAAFYDPLDNPIKAAEEAMNLKLKSGLGFRMWGLIVFLAGALVVAITLAVNAKKTDRYVEKELRRKARIGLESEIAATVKPAVNVVEVPAETKPEDTPKN